MTKETMTTPSSLTALRDLARAQAQALGLPHRKVESYRYLNLKTLRESPWSAVSNPPSSGELQMLRGRVRDMALPGRSVLVFWNGFYVSELSLAQSDLQVQAWMTGEKLTSQQQSWWQDLPSALKSLPGFSLDYFDWLNESEWGRGAQIRIPDGKQAQVQLLFVSSAASLPAQWSPFQVSVGVGAGAKVDVFEQHFSLSTPSAMKSLCWSQPELRVYVGSASDLAWTQLQDLAAPETLIQRTRFFVEAGAQMKALHISAGAALSRQNVDYHILGAGAQVSLNGITMVGPGQVADFHSLVDHVVGESSTRQLHKGILGSDSQIIFNGKVVIRKGAQKASSEQLNQNLLLSDRAEVDSKPELEIFADDVKATHGSAIGQLNAEEVFYLLSRGISRPQAQEMIALGSVLGLLEDVADPALKTVLGRSLSDAYRRIHD